MCAEWDTFTYHGTIFDVFIYQDLCVCSCEFLIDLKEKKKNLEKLTILHDYTHWWKTLIIE